MTIYLAIPEDVSAYTPIHCTSCGEYLGDWDDLRADFFRQGGLDGAFRLDEGQITRIDQDTMHTHEWQAMVQKNCLRRGDTEV
ncbi:hypothetical protein FVA77_24100 [Phyllobacterium endophyticum]|nr:hypothetical protein FVA77_24100 [Phyllobacterium endophyticum]